MNIEVRLPKTQPKVFVVDPLATLGHLKDLIFKDSGIPVAHQEFFLVVPRESDEATLASFGVKEGSTVYVAVKGPPTPGNIQLYVKTLSGRGMVIEVPPCASVGQTKEAISDMDGTPVSEQRLIAHSKQLNDNDALLSDLNIEHESRIHLLLCLRG